MKPEIGQTLRVRGILCEIVAILPAHTIDVRALDGTERYFRLSGLFW